MTQRPPAPENDHSIVLTINAVALLRGAHFGEAAIQAMLPELERIARRTTDREGQPPPLLNWYDMAAAAFDALWNHCEARTSGTVELTAPGRLAVLPSDAENRLARELENAWFHVGTNAPDFQAIASELLAEWTTR